MPMSHPKPPAVRKERKISHLSLFFPVTKNIGTCALYKLDDSGLRLIRVLHGCKVQ
jgi:hypothetical protein